MALKEVTVIFLYLVLFSTTIKSIIVYNNARFDPIDTRFILGQPFLVPSADDCVCECFNNTICFAATYFGINHICSLYFAQIYQGQLRVVPSIMNATAYFFYSASTTEGLKFLNYTNQTTYPIWNTTAGGDSAPATSGIYMGSYWPDEPPEDAFDNDFKTDYCSYGVCNYTYGSVTCGENTGLYLTLNTSTFALAAFYFATCGYSSLRDPLTITIEGSNQNKLSALTLGSSWTLIYNGSTGLTDDPGRSKIGAIQVIPNPQLRFSNYRLLVTSKRGIESCTSYSEFIMIGY